MNRDSFYKQENKSKQYPLRANINKKANSM